MTNIIEKPSVIYPNIFWLYLLAIFSFFVAIPSIKSSIGFNGIIIFIIITILIQVIFKNNNSLFFAWVALSPTIGQGVFIGSLTLSVLDIIALSYILRGNSHFTIKNNKIAIALIAFIILLIFTYLINTTISRNASVYKEIILLLVILKFSLKKHHYEEWIGIIKSLQFAAIGGILLHIFQIITNSHAEGNLFQTSSINAVQQYVSIGILAYISDKYRVRIGINPLIILIYIIFTFLSLSRTGLIYLIIVLIVYLYTWMKLKKISYSLIIAFIPIILAITSFLFYEYFLKITEIKEGSNVERYGVLIYYLQLIKNNIWFGIGFGNWQGSGSILQEGLITVSKGSGTSSSLNPHNTIIRILTDCGIFTTLTFIFIFFKTYIISKINEHFFFNSSFITRSFYLLLFITFFVADNTENVHFWACCCLGVSIFNFENKDDLIHV